MKSTIKYIFCLLIVIVSMSCGKYGYDFVDGYQEGETTGNNDDDTDMNFIDNSMFSRARVYPGMVGNSVNRIKDTVVNLDLNFTWVKSSDLRVSHSPTPLFSTGLYAPAGENIKITVPEGVLGLTVQVGAHMDDLSGKETLRRDPVIYTVKELFPGDNYIRNLYGGLVWIRASLTQSGSVPLSFSGVVRTSDFIHGVSNQTEWLKDVEANEVPWLELRTEHTIFTVPRNLVVLYKDQLNVDDILSLWNDIYEKDYYDWMGLTKGNPVKRHAYPALPERGVLDIQPSAGYAHSGFPWVAQQDMYWFFTFSNYDFVVNDFGSGGAWGTFHEIGHNYQQTSVWSWSVLGETTNNLFVFKAAERFNNPAMAAHPALNFAFKKALEFVETRTKKNFSSLNDWVDEGTQPFFRLTPFLQLFNRAEGKSGEPGWDFMTHLYTEARNSERAMGLDQAKIDFFYRALCDFTGKDYERFFRNWGIDVSMLARREMRTKYPALEKNVWQFNPDDKTGGDSHVGTKYDLYNSTFVYTSNTETADNDGVGLAGLNDGDYASYWHTCWSGCPTPELPVTIDIDITRSDAFKGLYYSNRDHSMVNTHIKVYVSNDNIRWDLVGDYDNLPNLRAERIEIEFDKIQEARYVRIEFPAPNAAGSTHVALGELGLFYNR